MKRRDRIAAAVVVFGLIAIAFVPGRGALALSTVSQNFYSRLGTRFAPSEVDELGLLSCIKNKLSTIPDGATAHLLPTGDDYLQQRTTELEYPRIQLVEANAQYDISVTRAGTNVAPSDQTCPGVMVKVVKHG